MRSDDAVLNPGRAMIIAPKVLLGNRRVPALAKALASIGWETEIYAMAPGPADDQAVHYLGGPGRLERSLDRIDRLGGPARSLLRGLSASANKRASRDRRQRFFADLEKRLQRQQAPDLVIAHDGFAAEFSARCFDPGVPVIADLVEDLEERSVAAPDAPDPKVILQRADAVLTVSEGLRQRLIGFGARPGRTLVLFNALPTAAIEASPIEVFDQDFICAGTLHPGDGVDRVITAVTETLKPRSLLIAGPCPNRRYRKKLERRLAELPEGRARWIGPVESDRLHDLVLRSRLMLIGFSPDRANFINAMPNRLFNALAAGTPIAVQKGLDAARWVDARGVGLSLDFTDPKRAARDLDSALEDSRREAMSKAALQLAKEIAWEGQSKAFLELISALQRARINAGRDGNSL